MTGPRLSLCLIARDEEAHLPRCLGSVAGLVDEVVVVDTGSRDRTPDIARAAGARVIHHPWRDDFAAARNAALDAATGDWVLVLDADEYLHPDDRPRLRPLLADGATEAYTLTLVNLVDAGGYVEQELSENVRLWRHRPEYRFEGAVHEQIVVALKRAGARVLPSGVRVVHTGYLDTHSPRHRCRLARNLALCRALAAAHPGDAFYRYSYGVALQGAGQAEAAAAELAAAARLLGPGPPPPWAPKLYKCLAVCHLARRAWADLDQAVAEGLARYPCLSDLVLIAGLGLLDQGRPAAAVGAFCRCLAMGPAPVPPHFGAWGEGLVARAHLGLARAYLHLGRRDLAMGHCTRAAAAAPGWLEPLALGAQVLLDQGGGEEALRWLAGLASPPAQAAALLAAGDPAAALAVAGQVPDPGERAWLEARCLWALHRPAEALVRLAAAGRATAVNGAPAAAAAAPAQPLPPGLTLAQAGLVLACQQALGNRPSVRALARRAGPGACAAAAHLCLEAAAQAEAEARRWPQGGEGAWVGRGPC